MLRKEAHSCEDVTCRKRSAWRKERKKKMYKKVSTDMNFVEREKEIEKFWADNQIFQKSIP